MTKRETERSEAIARLHEWVKPGDTVYTIVRHVSKSGMSRTIGVMLLHPDPDRPGTVIDLHPNHAVATAVGMPLATGNRDGVRVGGCGMDMGFHLVYELSHVLYPDGFTCAGENCPSNDHSNGDRDYTPHQHRDGGYALRQRWL